MIIPDDDMLSCLEEQEFPSAVTPSAATSMCLYHALIINLLYCENNQDPVNKFKQS